MEGIIKTVKKTFRVKEINHDNQVFKLFSQVSFGLCIIASLLVGASQYVGNPIHCTANVQIDSKLFDAHCWIHGSKHVTKEYQEEFDCITDDSVSVI